MNNLLFLLKRDEKHCWYGETKGLLIVAENETTAREIAFKETCHEYGHTGLWTEDDVREEWLKKATCEVVGAAAEYIKRNRILMKDYIEG
ncbi:MAG: hypothetical protein A3G49_03555 [Candidatus Sungbacteria bacterium RIFCSPLOWO2_12_FULL_41_11]|uniref:Uncharacterized protein n=1 Tax=Candidatus Sungbacteria bacterium RIFCSPLOWO2_12_FULL_41_11 TaxID=1802286 RepID=A0A1G2LT28_9BACT|nr:MAG: hypothetical protein A3D41_03985 [Candidatus Sungbacteria bacterium RIFCSPHIGHO2_02_FULL_41_12b]OHA14776.1 MAG: hypothetical protein A3G49_03555 [Candidatus Sungbacteria bacterium RIFCSPLOWO2_12_FULL_41_11]